MCVHLVLVASPVLLTFGHGLEALRNRSLHVVSSRRVTQDIYSGDLGVKYRLYGNLFTRIQIEELASSSLLFWSDRNCTWMQFFLLHRFKCINNALIRYKVYMTYVGASCALAPL